MIWHWLWFNACALFADVVCVKLVGRGSRLSRPEDEDNSPFHDDGNLHRHHQSTVHGLKDYEPVEVGAQVLGDPATPSNNGGTHHCPFSNSSVLTVSVLMNSFNLFGNVQSCVFLSPSLSFVCRVGLDFPVCLLFPRCWPLRYRCRGLLEPSLIGSHFSLSLSSQTATTNGVNKSPPSGGAGGASLTRPGVEELYDIPIGSRVGFLYPYQTTTTHLWLAAGFLFVI